jgi:hypothetical protein
VTISTETEKELVGVSPWVIGEILAIITLLVPLGIMPTEGQIVFYDLWLFGPFIYGLLWVLDSGSFISSFTLHFIDLSYMLVMVPLSIFSILYVRQIVRYYLGKSSRDSALFAGILGIIFPSVVSLVWPISFGIVIIIPIPIQFLIGLYILHRFEGPEVVSPWSGQFINWSWWKRLRRKISNRTAHIVEMHVEEEQEDPEWLESESE